MRDLSGSNGKTRGEMNGEVLFPHGFVSEGNLNEPEKLFRVCRKTRANTVH